MGAVKVNNWLKSEYDCGDDVCIVRENRGGIPIMHRWAAERVLEKGTKVRIEGICNSACVIFASIARANVCITPDAKIGIHMGMRRAYFNTNNEEVDITKLPGFEYFLPPPKGIEARYLDYVPKYGDDINVWAIKNNKLPPSTEIYVMTYEEALQFWNPCPIQ
jgi:hypothetical protein